MALGFKYFGMELVTASKSLSNCKKLNGTNYGSFFYTLKDSGGNNLAGPDYSLCTDSRIQYTFSNPINIIKMKIEAESDAPVTGNLYMILSPGPDQRELVSHISLEKISKYPEEIIFNPFMFMENTGDKMKLSFAFKGHQAGTQFKYFVTISGEEFEN